MNIVNLRIKELRESLGLSQEDFGASIGLSKSGISNIESGKRSVKEGYIELICMKYKVNRDWLLSNDITQQYNEFDAFIDYLKSFGYLVHPEVDKILQSHQEDMIDDEGKLIGKASVIDDATYIINISNGITQAFFTQEEFKALQQQNRANIDGAILLQSQKNKKEPPSAATENDSEDNS